MIPTHLLGNSGLRVSEISFGCMALGDDHAANARLLHQALDGGITLYDTADLYQQGRNEETVGRAFRDRRDRVILATKVGNQLRPDGSGWDWNPSKNYILDAVEKSLRRLQTDCVDLYQLHGGTLDDPLDETIDAFEILKKSGKIRAYGLSSIRPNVIREWVRRANPASVMMQYGLLDRRPEESSLALLGEKGIGVLARGSLAKGLLAGKPAVPFLTYDALAVEKVVGVVRAVSGTGRNPATTALRFALHPPAVVSAVVGIRTAGHLQAALDAGVAPAISEGEWQRLSDVLPPNHYAEHR